MTGMIHIHEQATIPNDVFQFPTNTPTDFLVTSFHDKYDGLLGMNALKTCELNMVEKFIKTNNTIIPIFFNTQNEIEFETKFNELNSLPGYPEINFVQNLQENIRVSHLNKEEQTATYKLINRYKEIFYKDGDDLSFTNHVKHNIPTTNESPIYTRSYRYPEAHKVEVNKQMKEMLDQGVIRESSSPYSSPVWVVAKKQDASNKQKWRIVIDYRKLNEVTKEDKFPLPNMDDILDKLGRANYFTTLDLAKGFHQIEMEPKDIEKTAFSTANGHYEFVRMPFGLKNAPATFQRMMRDVLKEFIGKICYVYLDDIIIFSTSLEEHICSLEKIFQRLREVNLKVQLDKTEFLKKETEFLGHIVTTEGIKANPKKLSAIEKFPIPKTVKEIQSFLGLTGYYRKFIPDYAKIAKPLTLGLKKGTKIDVDKKEYKTSFEQLKVLICNDPILIYPDFEKTFTLTTDASNFALGAVLSQTNKPVCYASRTLNAHECNYSTIEKELLAIVWATKQFRHYLYGRKFIVQTDHRPLVWLSGLKEPNSKLQRWKIKLEEYNFTVEYIQGKENVVADALSRIKINETDTGLQSSIENAAEYGSNQKNYVDLQSLCISDCEEEVNIIERKHLKNRKHNTIPKDDRIYECHICKIQFRHRQGLLRHFKLSKHTTDIEEHDDNTVHSAEDDSLDYIPISEKPLNQFKHQVIIKLGPKKPLEIITINGHKRIVYQTPKFMCNEFINSIIKSVNNQVGIYFPDMQIFSKFQDYWVKSNDKRITNFKVTIFKCSIILKDLPKKEDAIELILEYHNNKFNHVGIDKLYEEIKREYYYPQMKELITQVINTCKVCLLAKHERNPIKIPFHKTDTPKEPFQHYHIDVWFMSNSEYYITCIDKFSKYASYEKIEDKTFPKIIDGLEKLFITMPKPKLITHDNESAMITLLFKRYLEEKGIDEHLTIAHRHTGNADIERLHETLNEQIRIFEIRKKEQPMLFQINPIPLAINNYNSVIHSTTKEKPSDIHFGKLRDKHDEIYKRIEAQKEKTLAKRNKNRIDEEVNENLVKNTQIKPGPKQTKLPKFRIVKVHKKQGKHYEIAPKLRDKRGTKFYKDQFQKKRKYQDNNKFLFNDRDKDNTLDTPPTPDTYDPSEGTSTRD